MIDPTVNAELLKLVRCPVTGTSLSLADQVLIKVLNQNIELGHVKNRIGQQVSEKVDAGLVNQDRSLLMPIRGGIAVLVADQAIPITT